MTNKRDIFAELIEGFDSCPKSAKGKSLCARARSKSNKLNLPAEEIVAVRKNEDVSACFAQHLMPKRAR
jgi:hypothetical protein